MPCLSWVCLILKLKKTAKRYITRIRSDNKIELQFGSGVSEDHDAELIPNPKNVGNGLLSVRNEIDIDIDPSNFLYTRAYGQAPANTTLTVQYSVVTGLSDNVESNVLTKISEIKFNDDIYRDFQDVFDKKNSQRQFYTVPFTNPPDQTAFAHWLYNTNDICKVNQGKCLKYEDLKFKRLNLQK